jgi:hypothetical protein
MSIKVVKEEIERFLDGTDPEVLCISGKWGVGKTYSWNYYLKLAKESERISLERYAYVSLFGLKTLNELRYALYEATTPVAEIGKELRWDDLDPRNSQNLYLKKVRDTLERHGRWITSHLSRVPFIQNYVGLADSILFYFVGKQLICIDDLERAGSGLEVTDVFGLVSFLKEQRKCRIVLLLNDEEIQTHQKPVFEKQFEKVVDTHMHFDPRPDEAADIVFPSPEGIRKNLYGNCVTLGIKNIRVIKKIETICSRLEEILGEKYPDLMYQAVHSASLFAWSKYQKDSVPPPFDFLKNISRLHGISSNKETISEDDKRWQTLMAEYKFMSVDDFDSAIFQIVDSGVFDKDMLLKAAEKQSHGVAKNKQEQVIQDAWRLYHGSFDDNEKEVMDNIFNVSLENAKAISPATLDATVRMLKDFGRGEDAAKLIKNISKSSEMRKNYTISAAIHLVRMFRIQTYDELLTSN